MINNDKYLELLTYLTKMEKAVLAFSGGVDSTFLLMAAKEALGNKLKAVTMQTPYIPKWEINEAKELARKLGVCHEVIAAPIIAEIKNNPQNRCYFCKKAIFRMITKIAADEGYPYIIEGTNFDDLGDYRPGLQALSELAVKSPLLDCKLTKDEIRNLSHELGLSTWNKPPYACLLTRIPYGSELKPEDFEKIEQAEIYLMKLAFRGARVRCHNNLARIEINRQDRNKLFDEKRLDEIAGALKEIGFDYVTLDLEGYRMGSFNETIRGTKNGQ
ncbi:ATP-dependent sacrificial sulfur transferase LarE [Pelosinus propionicus]|uniref:Uncharacterized protein n=1 Tax=Pelosinus propionicus DSM 13327 TaxID=1123291 RepID=A0A1I4M422_9FIRM|nr:ATP-dependent sacrificial sulfur transferase LarE [Pelosinus propionicus]SFL97929.1 uncharacterized protein SAMN04490355_102953 [Pelosinus propionicus DSM 13327]